MLVSEQERAGIARLDRWVLVALSVVAGVVWSLAALYWASPELDSCAYELGVVVAHVSPYWAVLRVVVYAAAAWAIILLLRRPLSGSIPTSRIVGWIVCVVVVAALLTWGEIALYAYLRFDGGQVLPGFAEHQIHCQGAKPSLWPSWLPLPRPAG